jgi:hypothetical protein
MPLFGPTDEDLRKINLEVNQIVNQRFILTTLAISIFGVVLSIFIPREAPTGSDVGAFTYVGSIILLSVLLALFIYSYLLKRTLRVMTTYLIVTDRSSWEKDWQRFRNGGKKYPGYTRPHSFVFLFLGIVSAIYPYIISLSYGLTLRPFEGLAIQIAFVVAYFLVIVFLGLSNGKDHEKDYRKRWEDMNKF